MLWGISELVNARALNFLPLCSAPIILFNRNFWSSRNEWKPLSKKKNVFWENAVGYLRNGECQNFQPFAIVFSTHENLLVGFLEL